MQILGVRVDTSDWPGDILVLSIKDPLDLNHPFYLLMVGEKKRADLIFKYVKTLGPYSNQEDKSLYNRIHSARLGQK